MAGIMSGVKGQGKKVFEDALYECARCGTRVKGSELARLPSPSCANCGYRVFKKARGTSAKNIKAE